MATPKSKAGVRSAARPQVRKASKSISAETIFLVGPDQVSPKEATGLRLEFPPAVSRMLTGSPGPIKALLEGYGDAIAKSRTAGRRASFRVDVDPYGGTIVTPVEEAASPPEPVLEEPATPDPELQAALAAARERGRLRAAEILGGEDMLSADAFARMLGTTRVTVNTKRQGGQILGLDGAKRGFRFPVWQLDADGKPYAALATLHKRLGGAWAVYRFLVQPQGELQGLTGREALERGKITAALEAAESVGRDFG